MKNIQEPPIGILITHPMAFFKEYDYKKYIREHERMNTVEGCVWYRVMKNLPKQEFLYIYTIINGKLHHRTNLVGYIRNETMTFPRPEGGSRTFENANAIILGPPYVKCPIEIQMKGFQGFRYVTKELF
jgi:hypothetical protein